MEPFKRKIDDIFTKVSSVLESTSIGSSTAIDLSRVDQLTNTLILKEKLWKLNPEAYPEADEERKKFKRLIDEASMPAVPPPTSIVSSPFAPVPENLLKEEKKEEKPVIVVEEQEVENPERAEQFSMVPKDDPMYDMLVNPSKYADEEENQEREDSPRMASFGQVSQLTEAVVEDDFTRPNQKKRKKLVGSRSSQRLVKQADGSPARRSKRETKSRKQVLEDEIAVAKQRLRTFYGSSNEEKHAYWSNKLAELNKELFNEIQK